MISLMYMRKYLIAFILLFLSGCATYSNKNEMVGNPTTGFIWVNAIEKEGIVNLEEEVLPQTGSRLGAESVYRYTLTPIRDGETRIEFSYLRPWEGVPIRRVTYLVTVEKGRMRIENMEKQEENC